MAVEKMKLFEITRDRWPQSFRIIPTDGAPCFDAEPKLVAVYRIIEESCEPSGEWTSADEWTQLANWAFHQALWTLAEDATAEMVIRREDVTFEMFDHCLRLNLSDESWKQEWLEYERSPSRFH